MAGFQTNIAIPNANVTLDAGKNVEKVLERDLVISHYDGDHVEGIGRAICNAINTNTKLDIFLPSWKEHDLLKKSIKKFKKKDLRKVVKIHQMNDGEKVDLKKRNRKIEAFKVVHAPESLGYVIWDKDNGEWKQKLTYTGDINPSAMNMDIPQILDSETLVIDGSYTGAFLPFLEPLLDVFTNHASTDEIKQIAGKENKIKNIGVMHLPPATPCINIEDDLGTKFAGEDENVYYLQTCSVGTENPINKMASFKKVVISS